jgi:hypothetical protein
MQARRSNEQLALGLVQHHTNPPSPLGHSHRVAPPITESPKQTL